MYQLCLPPSSGAGPEWLEPGLLSSLLHESYAALVAAAPLEWGWLSNEFARFDAAAVASPRIIGRCIILSRWQGHAAGFVSWDPRGRPDVVVIGHNCVAPEYRRNGVGSAQLSAALDHLAASGFKLARVSTSGHPFFSVARRMYARCGFVEVSRQQEEATQRVFERAL